MWGSFLKVDGQRRRLLDADTITQSLFLAVAREACSTYGRLSEKRARIKSPAIAANRKLLLLASTVGTLVVSLAFEVSHKPLDSPVGLTFGDRRLSMQGLQAFPHMDLENLLTLALVRSAKTEIARVRRRRGSDRFKVIIWATDGSEVANDALPYVKSIAQAHGSKLIVVHVDEFVVGRGGGYSVHIDEPQVQAAILRQVEGCSAKV